ncbi:MAG: exo-alpha-sialidase [Deltaproteobacteria bacterium]|nr:MAG: exo-alpha-sialidase [Deltaproteobacteria bacterium]
MTAGPTRYCVDPGTGSTGGTDVHTKTQHHTSTLLFNPATDAFNVSYHSFRIPSIVRTKSGTLLAFAEGRQCSHADFGNINLVYKRSVNHGVSWSALREVVGSGAGTWGNPTAVVDQQTGRIWLFMSWNAADKSQSGGLNPCTGAATTAVGPGDRPVKVSHSDDDGLTWSSPVDMTATLQPAGTAWDAMGPGVGIQTSRGPHPGRLVVPAIRRNIYSDDHGATWHYAPLPGGTSEGTVVELSDGRLLRNDRAVGSVWETAKRRWLSRGSIEGGFAAFAPHDTLYDPRVEGSSIVYTTSPHRIVFLNPASTAERCKMRVRLSYDNGVTWPISRQLHDDLTATQTCDLHLGGYSSMTKTADYHVAALVERVEAGAGNHRGIELHRFNLPWVVDGTPEP